MIFTILFIILTTAFAQQEGTYNRFRHLRDEFIAVGKDLFDSYKDTDCEEARTDINISKTIFYSDTSSVESKRDVMRWLGHTNCQEVIDFYINILNNDPNKEIRSDAVLYLGWLRAKSSIPHLLETAKKGNDLAFVVEIAGTLCVMEEYDMAASILDKVCFNEDGSVKKYCIGTYEYAGREKLARNFWLLEWEKDNDEDSKFGIALQLVKNGIYDITFPIIKETVLGIDRNKRKAALTALGAIATEEALELIENCMNDEDFMIASDAKFIMDCLKEGRRYK